MANVPSGGVTRMSRRVMNLAHLLTQNARRHGCYSTEAIAERRGLAALIRLSRATLADLAKW